MYLLGCVLILCNVHFLDNFVHGAVLNSNLYRLDIVHYNDFHDRFEETSKPYPVCKTNDTSCLGGFARLYHEVMALMKEKPDALLLNAGDTFQGTYWYTIFKWNVTQTFINMLPNDAHAIGNHEFDDRVAGLVPYLAGLRAPVVAANMDVSKEPSLKGLFKPHIIVKRKGRKIGIIGLITPDTAISSNVEGVVFLDPIITAKKEAELLTEKGVDIIILLSHCGLDMDMEIARKVGENIDIIVGGHSHSLLLNGAMSPNNVTISGPYPVVVETKSRPGHKVLVVTALAFSQYLGNLTTYFDKEGELQSFDGEPVFLNRSIPEDPEIKALLQPYANELNSLVQTVVGFTTEEMPANPCGSRECTIGDLFADAFLNATKEMNVSSLTPIAFVLRNMIRGSIPKGEITRGGVINAMPFTNDVVTFTLSGQHLIETLEKCLTSYWTAKPFNGPWMPHVAGLRLTLNTTNGRVVSVLAQEGEKYLPLDLNKDYQVTTVKFLATGGNGLKMLKENGRNLTLVGKDAEILENFIRKVSPIQPVLDNRLIILN